MDFMVHDELLQEIFSKLSNSSPSSSSLPLVSKRWLRLFRSSRTNLCIKLKSLDDFTIPELSSFVSQHPFLSSLSIVLNPGLSDSSIVNDRLLLTVSSLCSRLSYIRFLAGPLSSSSLVSLSFSCSLLCSLTISLSRPAHLSWVSSFPRLKDLTIYMIDGGNPETGIHDVADANLGLEALSLSGLKSDDIGFGWLWRSCRTLTKLRLRSCEGVGDGGSFQSFNPCLKSLQKLELRTCRSLVSGILQKLAENSESLISLLIYDGGSSESLLNFINTCRSPLRELDFRLPLDLNNHHLLAANFKGLISLKLQSCCLVTGEGLKAMGTCLNSGLEELCLINCDVVGEESGLLAWLGQHMRKLKLLDLSYNELLMDKELTSMLVSLTCLAELKVRGCRRLTGVAVMCVMKNCRWLRRLDIMQCPNVASESIELLLDNLRSLAFVCVEDWKVSMAARSLAARNFVHLHHSSS